MKYEKGKLLKELNKITGLLIMTDDGLTGEERYLSFCVFVIVASFQSVPISNSTLASKSNSTTKPEKGPE